MRVVRFVFKLLALLAVAPILLVAVFYGLLKSGLIAEHVSDLITLLAKKDGVFFVRAEGVSGDLPEHLVIRKLEIGDGSSVYLTIENAAAWWHPLDIFHPFDQTKWKVDVEEIHAERVTWTHLPHDAKPDEEPFHWDNFVRIVIGHLRIDDFDLGGSLLGGAVERMRVEGSGVLGEWEHGFVKLDLEHIDGRRGKARIDVATQGSPLELSGRITAEEGPDGALAALARLDDAGAVTLDVRAGGAMRDWHAQAEVVAANIGVLRAKTSLSFSAEGPFEVTGTFDPEPLQRERYLVGAGEPITVFAKGAWVPDVELRLERVMLTADDRELSAEGRFDLATKEFRVDAGLVHKREGEAVRLTILDALAARVQGAGVLGDDGNLTVTIEVDAPVVGAVRAENFHALMTAREEKGDSVPSFELAFDAGGLSSGGTALPVLGAKARLTASGSLDLPAGVLKIGSARLEGGDLDVTGPVAFTDHWETVTAHLRAEAKSLASLQPLLGPAVKGRATAALDFIGRSAWAEVDAKLHVDASEVAVAEPGWQALIGGASTIDVVWTGAPMGRSRGRAAVKSAGIDAGVSGEWNVGGKGLVADARVVVDNLSRIAEPSRAAIAGKLVATAKLRGDLDRFDAVGQLRGERLVLGDARFDSLVADLEAKGLPKAGGGSVRVKARLGRQEASLEAGIETPSNGRLLVRQATLRGPHTLASADLDVDLRHGLAAGTVRIACDDISAWRPMTAVAASGAIDGHLALDTSGGVQKAGGNVKIRKASTAVDAVALSVDELDVTLDGVVLGSRPMGKATAHAKRLRYGATSLVEGAATAMADGHAWAFDSKLDIRDMVYLHLALSGTVHPGPPMEVTLDTLTGSFDTLALALDAPTRFRAEQDAKRSWSISGLKLAVGEGGLLAVDASRSAGRTRLAVDAESLPLAFVSVLAPALDLSGNIDAHLRLDGPDLVSSTGEITIHGHGIGSGGLEHEGVAPVDVTADAKIGGRRLRGVASVIGLSDSRLELDVDVPLGASAGSDSVVLELLWKGSIAEVGALLPFGADTVGGRIDAGLRLSGTVSSPRVTGRAVIDGGLWENAASGLVLRDLHAELEGNGTELMLTNARATDGDKGRVSAAGHVGFGRFPGFDADFNLDASDAMLARLDSVAVRSDTKLELKATRDFGPESAVGGSLTGSVRIDDARLAIPQRFVSDIPEIAVLELGADVEAEAATARHLRKAIDLDVAVVADNRIFVTGRGLESEWASDLHVRGTTSDPRVEGAVTSVHGQLSLLGRRFDLDSGSLRFDGAAGNIPYLTMIARADANDITAIASVTGPATVPTINLRSEPALPRDEVLSRVLFGQSAANLTAMQSVQLARSLAELTGSPLGGGAGMLTGIGRTLGFDRMEIDSAGASGAAALTASRYLTDSVYLRVQQGLTPDTSKLSLEWKVMKHVTIESDVSQDAQGEVGATWRWDY